MVSAPANTFMRRDFKMHRIAIIGCTGSGKSIFAKSLSARRVLPHTELDDLYGLPDWRERDKGELRQLVAEATDAPAWLVDGGYSEVRELVWGRADTLIWLDQSLLRTAM